MLHSTSVDPFELVLYKLMCKLDPCKRNIPLVTAMTEDSLVLTCNGMLFFLYRVRSSPLIELV